MTQNTILLVEDNPDDEELTLLAFRQSSVPSRIIVARDGVEALDYLLGSDDAQRESKAMPVLILLDLKLPRMDGLEVLRRLRANERTCIVPVVILTTSREEQDLIRSYRLGCNSYICKPVDFSRFSEAMQQLGMYWLILNESPPL